MDDFKKPYEYEEAEKRGYLIFFILMVLVIDTFLSAAYVVQINNIFMESFLLRFSFIALSGLFIIFLLFTIFTCIRLSKNFVAVSKLYLIIRTVYMSIGMLILFITIITGHDIAGSNYGTIKSSGEIAFTFLIIPLFYSIVFLFGWNLYFKKSKRCKEIIAAKSEGHPIQGD